MSNLRMPGGFLNEVSGDLLGTHFLHQVRESGGTIWITESDGTEVCFPLDSTLPDVLLAAVVAAVGAWKARNSHLQSDVAEPPETTSADDEEEMRAQVVDMIWHASQKEYRAGWHPMIEYALVGHTGAWPLLAARTGWPAAFDDCKRPAGWTTWQAAQAARDEHRAWAQRFFHDDTMPSTEARPELGTSVSPAAPSDLPTQHFLRCSGCAARMRLDAVHTDTRGTIVWAAWECAHTRIVQWYPGDPLRIESLSGVGNPWRRPPADTKRSPFHE